MIIKRRHDDKELPVFNNMNDAREHFGRRRETIYKGINALLPIFGLIIVVFQILFHPPFDSVLVSVIFLVSAWFNFITEEPDICAPKEFKVFYVEEDKKWLLFPADKYPAVAFVLENQYETIDDRIIDDHAMNAFEKESKKNAVMIRIYAGSLFLSAILILISPTLFLLVF